MKNYNKQRLFEVMCKVNPDFKSKLNEEFSGIPQEYEIEFNNLKNEYGEQKVNSLFPNGLQGFYDSRTRGNYSIDAIKQNLREELAVASDGGYYDKPEHAITVTSQEAAEIKQITDAMYNELFSPEGVTKVDANDKLKQEIINGLKQSGIQMDYDSPEPNIDVYWIANESDLEPAKEEFKLIVSNLYDKVQDESLNEAGQIINPKYTHFAVTKDTTDIVNGWDYNGIEPVELRQFKKDYFFDDLTNMGIDPHGIKVVTAKYLQSSGINPFDPANWKQ